MKWNEEKGEVVGELPNGDEVLSAEREGHIVSDGLSGEDAGYYLAVM